MLAVLWIAFAAVTVIAFFAILFTGRYPRPLFGFNLGVLRWPGRVVYYTYSALVTDRDGPARRRRPARSWDLECGPIWNPLHRSDDCPSRSDTGSS